MVSLGGTGSRMSMVKGKFSKEPFINYLFLRFTAKTARDTLVLFI